MEGYLNYMNKKQTGKNISKKSLKILKSNKSSSIQKISAGYALSQTNTNKQVKSGDCSIKIFKK